MKSWYKIATDIVPDNDLKCSDEFLDLVSEELSINLIRKRVSIRLKAIGNSLELTSSHTISDKEVSDMINSLLFLSVYDIHQPMKDIPKEKLKCYQKQNNWEEKYINGLLPDMPNLQDFWKEKMSSNIRLKDVLIGYIVNYKPLLIQYKEYYQEYLNKIDNLIGNILEKKLSPEFARDNRIYRLIIIQTLKEGSPGDTNEEFKSNYEWWKSQYPNDIEIDEAYKEGLKAKEEEIRWNRWERLHENELNEDENSFYDIRTQNSSLAQKVKDFINKYSMLFNKNELNGGNLVDGIKDVPEHLDKLSWKKIFRRLAMLLHPDRHLEDKSSYESAFKDLMSFNDSLPNTIRAFNNNWYKIAKSIRSFRNYKIQYKS